MRITQEEEEEEEGCIGATASTPNNYVCKLTKPDVKMVALEGDGRQ